MGGVLDDGRRRDILGVLAMVNFISGEQWTEEEMSILRKPEAVLYCGPQGSYLVRKDDPIYIEDQIREALSKYARRKRRAEVLGRWPEGLSWA